MKKLSEFEGDAAFNVIADLMMYINEIKKNPETQKLLKAKDVDVESALFKDNKHAITGILAALSGVPIEEYRFTAYTLIRDFTEAFKDPGVQMLFGVQRQTPASAGSASESTEAPAK